MAKTAFMDKRGNIYIYSNTKNRKYIKEIRYINGDIFKITHRKVNYIGHAGKTRCFDKKIFKSYLNNLKKYHKNSNNINYDKHTIVIS